MSITFIPADPDDYCRFKFNNGVIIRIEDTGNETDIECLKNVISGHEDSAFYTHYNTETMFSIEVIDGDEIMFTVSSAFRMMNRCYRRQSQKPLAEIRLPRSDCIEALEKMLSYINSR